MVEAAEGSGISTLIFKLMKMLTSEMEPKTEGTHLLLSPFTTVTRVGGSLSLVWVDLGPSHIVMWRRIVRCGKGLEPYNFMSSLH